MLFDTHAHYYDQAFDGDRDAVLSALPAAGVGLGDGTASVSWTGVGLGCQWASSLPPQAERLRVSPRASSRAVGRVSCFITGFLHYFF